MPCLKELLYAVKFASVSNCTTKKDTKGEEGSAETSSVPSTIKDHSNEMEMLNRNWEMIHIVPATAEAPRWRWSQ
jgi:hypothetical protein